MRKSVAAHAGISLDSHDDGRCASWVLEGGDIMPEPGEEAEWLAKHAAADT